MKNLPSEFFVMWLQGRHSWLVVDSLGTILSFGKGSVGAAVGESMDHLGCGEADYSVMVDQGDFYRYELDE
jgi:hypothetical protein